MTKPGKRPVLNIPLSPTEVFLEAFAAIGLVTILVLTYRYWPVVPSMIPTHFGVTGMADAWGGKETLLLLPTVSVLMYATMTLISRYPQLYNYPWPITGQNAEIQYRLARSFMVCSKTEIMWLFTFIQWKTVQTAAGKAEGLGTAFLPVFLVFIIGTLAIYLYRAYSLR